MTPTRSPGTESLDRAVAYLLDRLEVGESLSWRIERILRASACPVRHRRVSVADMSVKLGVSRRHLTKSFTDAGLPTTNTFLAWGRLLGTLIPYGSNGEPLRAHLHRHGWCSPFDISLALDRYAGLRPSWWKRDGASLTALCDGFIETWANATMANAEEDPDSEVHAVRDGMRAGASDA